MDALLELLAELKRSGLPHGHLQGFLHVIIGRQIKKKDGKPVSSGITWRELANYLKKLRWDPELVAELGIKGEDLPPRDRERFWYSAIVRARVDTPEAQAAGDKFAAWLKKKGYDVGPAPGMK
jgi:glycerol kinase